MRRAQRGHHCGMRSQKSDSARNFVFFYVYQAMKRFAAERQVQITNSVSLCHPHAVADLLPMEPGASQLRALLAASKSKRPQSTQVFLGSHPGLGFLAGIVTMTSINPLDLWRFCPQSSKLAQPQRARWTCSKWSTRQALGLQSAFVFSCSL